MKIDSEVLIYVQKVILFMKNNEQSKIYFHIDEYEDMFVNLLREKAIKNHKNEGDPSLSQEDFEAIKRFIIQIKLNDSVKLPFKFYNNRYILCLN